MQTLQEELENNGLDYSADKRTVNAMFVNLDVLQYTSLNNNENTHYVANFICDDNQDPNEFQSIYKYHRKRQNLDIPQWWFVEELFEEGQEFQIAIHRWAKTPFWTIKEIGYQDGPMYSKNEMEPYSEIGLGALLLQDQLPPHHEIAELCHLGSYKGQLWADINDLSFLRSALNRCQGRPQQSWIEKQIKMLDPHFLQMIAPIPKPAPKPEPIQPVETPPVAPQPVDIDKTIWNLYHDSGLTKEELCNLISSLPDDRRWIEKIGRLD